MAKKSDGALATAKPDNDYEADSALETLTRAEEIKQDKKLMKRVAGKAGRKMKAINGLSSTIAKHTEKTATLIDDVSAGGTAILTETA